MNTSLQQMRLLTHEKPVDIDLQQGVITQIHTSKASSTDEPSWLLPAFVDLSLTLKHHKQAADITAKAYAQGFSYVCVQPDSTPIIDSQAQVRDWLKQNSTDTACLLPIGALTQGLQGEQLANMAQLKEAGCIALSHARYPIANGYVLRRCMEYAHTFDMLLMLSANDPQLAMQGCVHEGSISTRLGLPPHPEVAETVALAQILLLAEHTGARVHISQISCAKSVQMIRLAKAQGLNLSADVAIANLLFTHQQVNGFNSQYHLQPVLRTEADRQALLQAVNAGELAVCSNHHQLGAQHKQAPFSQAEPGLNLLSDFIPSLLSLIKQKELDFTAAMHSISTLPRQILGLEAGIQQGRQLDGLIYHKQQIKRLQEVI